MMKDHPVEDPSSVRWIWLCRAPLLVAAVLITSISSYSLNRLVFANSPRDPWEATEVLEAWRSLQGLPVYEDSFPVVTPPTSMELYVPWIQGEIFRWVGPNNITGRLLTLISALATVTLLALTLRGQRSAWYLALAWAMILGVNHRSGQYFAENRPDMTAMMFAAAGVLLMAVGQEKRRAFWVVLGSACLVAGFFFKQTAFIFAAVPLVALVLRRERAGPLPTHRSIHSSRRLDRSRARSASLESHRLLLHDRCPQGVRTRLGTHRPVFLESDD